MSDDLVNKVTASVTGQPAGEDAEAIEQTRNTLQQAIAAVKTPEQAEQVVADLEQAASTKTATEVAKQVPEPADAEQAAQAIQQAGQAPPESKPQAVILETAVQIAAAEEQDKKTLSEGVAQATSPEIYASPPELKEQRQLLREALFKRLDPLNALDVAIYLAINEMPHLEPINACLYGLSVIMNRGDGYVLGLAAAALRDHKHGRKALLDVLPALWLTTAMVEFPIKHYFRRKRPFISIVRAIVVGRKPGGYSFPSGHSAAAFGGAWLLRKEYPQWTPAFYALAGLVGFSRVYLGAHYPGDVMSGAVTGTVLAEAFQRVMKEVIDALD